MKHAKLKIALAAAAAVTFALGLVGCSGGENKADYDHVVTFDYNNPVWECKECSEVMSAAVQPETCPKCGSAKIKKVNPDQYIGVKDGMPVALTPGGNKDFKLASMKGLEFDGWYQAKSLDSSGQPVRDEDGRVILGKEWNFRARVTEDITLYAKFAVKARLTISGIAVGEDGVSFSVTLENQSDWDDWDDMYAAVGSTFTRPISDYAPKAPGYTFLEYYEDEALTKVFDWENYTLPEEGGKVYAKFRVGNWALNVTTAAQFNSAISANKNISLGGPIDFTDVEWTKNRPYSGFIEGNGYTVSNITCVWNGGSADSYFALFGALGKSFKATDVSFENINLSFTAEWSSNSGAFTVSAFANSIHSEAVFENFSFSATLTAKRGDANEAKKAKINIYEICPDAPSDLAQYFNVTLVDQT